MNEVIITWKNKDLKEQSTFRYGMPFEYYEALAGTGIEVFSEKHGIPETEIDVEILVKFKH